MTTTELQRIVRKNVQDGVAGAVGHLYRHHKALSEACSRAARCARRGDGAGLAKELEAMSRIHDQFATAEGVSPDDSYADSYRDVTRERDIHPVRDARQSAKSDAVDLFFERFYHTPTEIPAGPADVAKIFE